MDPEHLRELSRIEQGYWWNVAKRELAHELLLRFAPPPGLLVEGGVGAGGNLVSFRDMGYEVLGFDESAEAVALCQAKGAPAQRQDLEMRWPVAEHSARAVVLLDVLEHLARPVAVLEHARRCLERAGRLLVAVPANPGLMGPWDEQVGHYRRYSRRRLVDEARHAGLEPVWLSHWNSFTLPVAAGVRLFERVAGRPRSAEFPRVPERVNAWLEAMARVERRVMRRQRVPFGMSVVGVFRP
jgi:SAM-dependent methyltransferase